MDRGSCEKSVGTDTSALRYGDRDRFPAGAGRCGRKRKKRVDSPGRNSYNINLNRLQDLKDAERRETEV